MNSKINLLKFFQCTFEKVTVKHSIFLLQNANISIENCTIHHSKTNDSAITIWNSNISLFNNNFEICSMVFFKNFNSNVHINKNKCFACLNDLLVTFLEITVQSLTVTIENSIFYQIRGQVLIFDFSLYFFYFSLIRNLFSLFLFLKFTFIINYFFFMKIYFLFFYNNKI
jgi:hypothetical protein